MPNRSFLLAVLVGAIWLAPGAGIESAPAARSATPPQAPPSPAEYVAIVNKYCVTCHNERAKTGGLALDTIDFSNLAGRADVWEKAIRKVRVGMMPPQGAAQPDAATRARLVAWLADAMDRAATAAPNPGRPLLHRLNRAEYANAVRDLLALEVDPATLLPPDDSAYGFDNIGDVLGMSPVLLERYMDAAGKVSALAVGDPDVGPSSETFRIRQDASQDAHIDGMPIGTVGGILAPVTLPLDGEYMITVQMFRTNLGVMRGLEYEHEIAYTVDGQEVHRFRMGGEADFKANLVNMTKARRSGRRAGPRAPAAHGRSARDRRGIRRAQRGGESDAAAAVRPQFNRYPGHLGPPALRSPHRHRSVQPHRARRHAQPRAGVHLPAEDGGGRRSVRAGRSSRRWRAGRTAAT